MANRAVIIGAGALGLGFLAERMAQDYQLCFADIGQKSDVLGHLRNLQEYTLNLCGAQGIRTKTIRGCFQAVNMDAQEERKAMHGVLQDCDAVLTATSRSVLGAVVSRIAPALNAASSKTWLLFGENGLQIASEHAPSFDPQVVLVDTVMLRMCRLTRVVDEPHFSPLWPGYDQALVVEAYDYIPLDSSLCQAGPFSSAFSLVSPEEFRCWEHIKFYLFNGLHAFISYHAFLRGVEFFSDVPQDLLTRAQHLITDEIVPALAKRHRCSKQDELERYGQELIARFVNPYFNDRIARGVRGVEEKLSPNERLHSGCRFIQEAGLVPREYASTIEAGKGILAMTGNSE